MTGPLGPSPAGTAPPVRSPVRPGGAFDAPAGVRRRFGPPRGQPGGEGAVFAVEDDPGVVAKIYHAGMPADKVAKVQALIVLRKAHPELAWCGLPTELVRIQGVPRGFLMPYFGDGHELHLLSSPASRRQHFPQVRYDFLLRVAANLVSEVGRLHAAGLVIGDVNCRGFLVDRVGLIHIIDCDSFHFTADGTTFRCTVGMTEYLPPELQGVTSLAAVDRTRQHDAFAVAVLLFQLLFQDRHPYFGVPLDPREQTMDLAEVIRRHRFAYGARAAQHGVRRPPLALPLETLPDGLRTCFERAFSPLSVAAGRPTMNEWRQALEDGLAGLVECPDDRSHLHFRHAGACPWCALEDAGGPRYFPGFASAPGAVGEVAPVPVDYFRKVLLLHPPVGALANARVTGPGPFTERLLAGQGTRTYLLRSAARNVRTAGAAVAGGAVLAAVTGLVAPWLAGGAAVLTGAAVLAAPALLRRWHDEHASRCKRHLAALECRRDSLLAVLGALAATAEFGAMRVYDEAIRDLESGIAGAQRRWEAWQEESARLTAGNEQLQRQDFLARFPVRGLRLPGLEPRVQTALAAHGVATAAEVDQRLHRGLALVPEAVADQLDGWCAGLLAGFRYDPLLAAGAERLAGLRQRFLRQKAEDERTLHALVQRLAGQRDAALAGAARLPGRIAALRHRLVQEDPDAGELAGLHRQLAQVEADLVAMRTLV